MQVHSKFYYFVVWVCDWLGKIRKWLVAKTRMHWYGVVLVQSAVAPLEIQLGSIDLSFMYERN